VNGYVLVGDSGSNELVQFRDVASRDLGQGILMDSTGRFQLFKIEPVTFEGFYPVTIRSEPLRNGQNVTIAGYSTTGAIPRDSAHEAHGFIEAFDASVALVSGFLTCSGPYGSFRSSPGLRWACMYHVVADVLTNRMIQEMKGRQSWIIPWLW
jgi:hypothetical protein